MRPDHEWLYVDPQDIPEAMAFGASFQPGDARLLKPRPLPPGVQDKHFARWQTDDAVRRWLTRHIDAILRSVGVETGFEEFSTVGVSDAALGRVYLWVCRKDASEVRYMDGIKWDRRRGLFYATRKANLDQLFRWLTPAAKAEWEAEQAAVRVDHQMVRDAALIEMRRRSSPATAAKNPPSTPKLGGRRGADSDLSN